MSDEKNYEEFEEDLGMEEAEIIELTDEDGNSIEAEVLDIIEFEDEYYMVILPTKNEEEGILIMRIEQSEDEDGEDNVLPVDDVNLINTIYEEFKSRNADLFDFEEGE